MWDDLFNETNASLSFSLATVDLRSCLSLDPDRCWHMKLQYVGRPRFDKGQRIPQHERDCVGVWCWSNRTFSIGAFIIMFFIICLSICQKSYAQKSDSCGFGKRRTVCILGIKGTFFVDDRGHKSLVDTFFSTLGQLCVNLSSSIGTRYGWSVDAMKCGAYDITHHRCRKVK